MEYILIEAVQMHHCLFDKASAMYRNKLAKEKAWRTVAAATNATVEQCQSRWRSLRDRYVKEVNGGKAASGSGAKDASGWRYLDAMCFLQRHVAPRNTSSNMQCATVGNEEGTSDNSFSSTILSSHANNPWVAVDVNTEGTSDETLSSTLVADEDARYEKSPMFSGLSAPLGTSTPHAHGRQEKRRRHEDRFNTVCDTVSNWLKSQTQSPQPVSRNADFLKVLDSYLLKHPEDVQDRIKIKLLNIVCNEKM